MTANPGGGRCPVLSEDLVEQAWQELLNVDDRTSPEEYPDMALIKFDELREIIASFVKAATLSLPAGGVAVSDAMVELIEYHVTDDDDRSTLRNAVAALFRAQEGRP